MLKGFIWVIFTAVVVHRTDGLHCFSCFNVTEENDCSIVTKCLSDQKCYAQRSGHGNQTRFNFGCIESQRCPDHHDFTIVGRSTTDQCLECCLQDGCNKELCELQHVSDVNNPETCVDDPAINCTQLSKLTSICSDVSHAKNVCRKYCGLCALIDGDWSKWSEWTPCSTSCGVGTHTRKRNCTNPAPQHGGEYCSGNDTQVHSCFLRACPVHGEWSGWNAWEGCSVSCGEGVMKRHRTCTNPTPSLYGHYCIGDSVEYNICHEQPCGNVSKSNVSQPIICTDASSECDIFNRTINLCNQQEQARKVCAKFCGLCSIVDGKWATWSVWSTCSTSCDNGTWTRTRTCTDPAPANGSKPCVGNSMETGVCQLRSCPVHGDWSPWAHWNACSSTCGQGLTKRFRSCTNPRPSLSGNNCFGDSMEYGMCLIKPCPVDGQWTPWLHWSMCSVTCGTGQRTRQRLCSNPGPINGGKDCPGVSSEQGTCQAVVCPDYQIGFSASGRTATSVIVYTTGDPYQGLFYYCSWVIIFTNITSNYGNAYSAMTGMFTCPYSGLYHFSVRLIYASNCTIFKNSGSLQDVISHDTNETNAFSNVHLSKGDRVYVKCSVAHKMHCTAGDVSADSSFSGFLINAD